MYAYLTVLKFQSKIYAVSIVELTGSHLKSLKVTILSVKQLFVFYVWIALSALFLIEMYASSRYLFCSPVSSCDYLYLKLYLLSVFSLEPNCIFNTYLKVLCIETSTSMGSMQKFEGAKGEFKGLTPANFEPQVVLNVE